MLELTTEQCLELERRVKDKLSASAEGGPYPELQAAIAQIAVPAVICTIREYERMKQQSEEHE